MTRHRAIVAAALSGASLLGLHAPAAAEGSAEAAEASEIEGDILITTTRPAYRGEFEPLEIPQAEQVIGLQQLRDINAPDLNAALDLSGSVARQNNFGGLWNAFAVRGFAGDENLPSNYLVNGFNAGRRLREMHREIATVIEEGQDLLDRRVGGCSRPRELIANLEQLPVIDRIARGKRRRQHG